MRRLFAFLVVVGLAWAHGAEASVLSDAADAMAADSWASITTNNINDTDKFLESGGLTGFITGDATKGCYDPVTGRAHFLGMGHFTGTLARHVVYVVSTNTWVRYPDVPFGSGTVNHNWNGVACDARGRGMYRRNINSQVVWKYDLDNLGTGSGWTSLGSVTIGDPSAFGGVGFHYDGGTGQRGVLLMPQHDSAPNARIATYSPSTGTISTLGSLTFDCDSSQGHSEYSEVHNISVVYCSPTDSFFRTDTRNGIVTAATKPCTTEYNRGGIIHADPATGNFVLLCGSGAASWHIYDPVANTWTTKAAPSGITNHILNVASTGGTWPTWGKVGIPISDHGVILYIACTAGGCETRLYKGGTFTTADRAWKQQIYRAGILRAIGFDSANELLSDGPGTNVTGVSATPGVPALDTTVKASGIASLKWTIGAGQDGNGRGLYGTNFAKDMSVQIGPTGQSPANTYQEYWIQIRTRYDTNAANSIAAMSTFSPKMFWVSATADRSGAGQSSCVQQEIVIQPYSDIPDILGMYHACPGTFSPGGGFLFTRECGPGNPLCTTFSGHERQLQHVANCEYAGSRTGCKRQSDNPNTWRTFTARVKVPAWYQNTSTYTHTAEVEVWLAEEATPSTRVQLFRFVNDSGTCTSQTSTLSPDEVCGFDLANTSASLADRIGKLWVTTYSNGEAFSLGGAFWVDNIIISTVDPGDPGTPVSGGSAPAAPSNLRVVP